MKRFLFALLLLACSKPEADPGACYRVKDSACVAYPRETAAAGRSKCVGFEWRATCPTENRVGTCRTPTTTEFMYGGPPNAYDAATARKVCTSNGGAFEP